MATLHVTPGREGGWRGRPPGLPDSVPPPSVPLSFFVAAAGLVACGAALIWCRSYAIVDPTNRHVIVAAHLAVLATLSMGVLGGLVCIAIVVRVARHVLNESSQLALIRVRGRRYGLVGTVSLLVAFVGYLLLAGLPSSWSALTSITAVAWIFLIVLTWRAIVQTRAMSTLRRSSLATCGDPPASTAMLRGRRAANALPVAMGLTSVTVLVLVAVALAR